MAIPGEDDLDRRDHPVEGSWEEEEQLTLADEDEDLPWLEADEYDEDGGFDARLIIYAVLGLAVIALLLGAIWWFTQDRADPELEPDGSTIEAPEGPYKQRPEDPAGAEVAGTGDQAFETAEGQSTRGRLNDGQDARPSIDRSQTDDDATSAPADDGNAVYVQIGAFSSRSDAEAGWSSAAQRYGALSGMRHRIVEAEVNGSTVYRLQAVAGDRPGAEATCRAIRNAGGDCYIR